MAQGIYDKLEETLKLLIALNKQLCCEYTPPPPSSTTTTSTTTQPQEFFRASWLLAFIYVNRQGVIASRSSWYSGNTVASIQTSNPNLVLMQIESSERTGSTGWNATRIVRETNASPAQSVTPTYVSFDGISNLPIMTNLKHHYDFCQKIINTTFLSTRNASVFIKRGSSSNGLGSGVFNDAIFIVGIDFDSTGLERDGYSYLVNDYDLTIIPGTLNVSNFTYSSLSDSPISFSNPNVAMSTFSPSTSWVNNITSISGVIIREDFPIPPGW